MAFLPGTLDRTNEFYTMIGDNHFVKKSSFRTVELLDRRQISMFYLTTILVDYQNIYIFSHPGPAQKAGRRVEFGQATQTICWTIA